MRSHTDIRKDKDAAKFVRAATGYYEEQAKLCVQAGHVVDVFVCCLDQVGVVEMQSLVTRTGGAMVVADSFKQSVFKESFRRVFDRHEDDSPPCDAGHLTMAFGGTLEVQCSQEFKVCGAMGQCTSLKKSSPSVAEHEIGEGGTHVWALGGITPRTTLALFFELVQTEPTPLPATKRRFLQIVTRYQHASGKLRLRVTTTAGAWRSDPNDKASLAAGFDQEAAAVLLSRIAIERTASEDSGDILRWLDRSLIRLCSHFASYRPDDTGSFSLTPTMSILPQFIYHLRRSGFVRPSNASPDETTYKRIVFLDNDVANSVVMIQPSLIQYSFTEAPHPVLLDSSSLRPDVVLLLDTFFHVVIWYGDTVANWRQQGYQNDPQHATFRALLEAPKMDAQSLVADRFPFPRYIQADQFKSQARFLVSKVAPSVTHHSTDGPGGAEAVLTDDVSFRSFMQALISLAVSSS